MFPRHGLGIKPVKVLFRDPAGAEELVILLGARNRSQDVEGRDSGIQPLQYRDVLVDFFRCVFGESDDVRKMTLDLVRLAQSHDLAVDARMILGLSGGDKSFPAERFRAHEHLEATRSAEQMDKGFL